ncbi:hypothetical protein H8356DRAFT_1340614 [Neocallimastix lanati (nom. inval.)]|nr:hypothetical protein H8356DRAFT_1340614 [Neocallimastix sp. JGI-2020a]
MNTLPFARLFTTWKVLGLPKAELNNFIPATEKRFGEVERRVEEEETSGQASNIQHRLAKEAAIDHEIHKILMKRLQQKFNNERTLEEVKTAMLNRKRLDEKPK